MNDQFGNGTHKESAMPTHPLDRRVLLKTAPNFRDLGGIPVADGTVRAGALYRSATLAKLDGDDVAAVADLDVRTVYDLRTAAERAGADGAISNGNATEIPSSYRAGRLYAQAMAHHGRELPEAQRHLTEGGDAAQEASSLMARPAVDI
ncbi:tyrosine-protein phosphatase [Rhodococcus erythropolis]|uniref:Tyrosine-protein phosphatase n=1 Tax=Rhodococcus erythropolis TaxID=1833 RepID=A0AAX3ZXR6_RHOER|nr:tyrosine-protein phosphatase [Rhodococcus erythropolis]WMN01843.1 tyrosine-protein phosphatase [Rhodococcus erythropolis]